MAAALKWLRGVTGFPSLPFNKNPATPTGQRGESRAALTNQNIASSKQIMTATTRQEEILHQGPALRNAQRPFRHPLLKTKSLPSLPQLRADLLDSSLHLHHKGDDDDDSMSSLEDTDDWRSSERRRLTGLSKQDPNACRLLLSHAQKTSLENSCSNLNLSKDAPAMPFRKRSLLKSEQANMDEAIERLQRLSMSAPNLRYSISNLDLDLEDDNDDEDANNTNHTVVTPTRRRNPDHDERDSTKSPRTVYSDDTNAGEPRVLLSKQQTRSFSRRERLEQNRSTSPNSRRNQRAKSDGGCSTGGMKRRARVRVVRAMSTERIPDKDGKVLLFEPDEDSPTSKDDTGDDTNSKKPVLERRSSTKRPGSRRPSAVERNPLVRSDSKTRTSTSPFRARLQISRQKLIEKLTDAGVAADQHEEMMNKMGFGSDMIELNQSAEF
ncbi:hypothetical protein MPSEU_001056200 [Mayamaea pseudoterrestris]|nr:hypothetical protein MPSEU_001056200 [Mayamaea pseudoterrestris]